MFAEGESMELEKYLAQIAKDLGADQSRLEQEYRKGGIIFGNDYKIPYLRFRKGDHDIEDGTVVFLGKELAYARGFPKIRRAMFLDGALKKHMKGRFQAEEKLDGYNVRTVYIGELISLTRKGVFCPYTTEHVKAMLKNNAFFGEHKNLMLCGEVVGLQNPYQTKSYPEAKDFGYFVFDIKDRKTGRSLSVEEKNRLIAKYNLPSVRSFGIFTSKDSKKLLALVRKLGNEKREGMVLKALDMENQIKYTSNQSTNNDLRYAFKFVFDYGQQFMFRRLVREAFQAYELGLSKKELEKEAGELGKAILIPMVETIRRIAEGSEVTEDFEINVPDVSFGKAFIEHLKHLGVKATIEHISKGKKETVIKVKRHYPSTNDKVKSYLSGEFGSD
jgi:putative ATP-dependent DNA ligase